MADYGARYADRAIAGAAKELKSTYRKAQKELKEKLAGFEKRFEQTNRMKRKQLEEGKITDQQYRDWLTGQVFIRNQWQQSIREVSAVMHSCNSQAAKMINERRLDVFAENYNYMAFKGEGITGVSFGVYNTQAVARLIMDDPKILPEWKVDEEKDYEWNERKVNGIVRQGIIQGESIPEITDRLCRDLSAANENKMMLFARTAITGAQNAGRQQQMNDAADMGIDIHKQWLATLDSRTRDSHRKLDGQEVPYNENFVSLYGEIEYPGDPDAKPADVFNCRCTIVSIYPKYEDRSKPDWREEETIDGMTYQEWKENKKAEGKHEAKEEKSELEQKIAGIVKGEPMTHEEADTGRVNPKYGKGIGYRINCQSCVVAYEARRRGYDVEVVPNDKDHPMCGKLARNTRLAWKDKKTGENPEFMFQSKPTLASKWEGEPPTPKRFKALLQERLEEGARYHIGFGWKGSSTSGHIVTIRKEAGELVIYDPQCDETYKGKQVDQYLARMKMQRTSYGYKFYQYPEVLRVDDKDIDTDVVGQVVKGVGT